ncbi:MAG: hypothetical protein JWM76_4466 [Pseudonocardiales bacterium]|nr:hypothetical protein [Pseudonocardiales bacterium]
MRRPSAVTLMTTDSDGTLCPTTVPSIVDASPPPAEPHDAVTSSPIAGARSAKS